MIDYNAEITQTNTEIEKINNTITKILENGQSTQIGTGSGASASITQVSIESLYKQRAILQNKLKDLYFYTGQTNQNPRVNIIT